MKKVIYLDMDGTIANLYKGNWLEKLMASDTSPYQEADRLVNEYQLKELINEGFELGIISWLAKTNDKAYNKEVRKVKKTWLKENYPNIKFSEIHIVKYGTQKSRVAKVKNQILVDDEQKNRDTWKGLAFSPEKFF